MTDLYPQGAPTIEERPVIRPHTIHLASVLEVMHGGPVHGMLTGIDPGMSSDIGELADVGKDHIAIIDDVGIVPHRRFNHLRPGTDLSPFPKL